jgi:NADPH:quinone reductase-like Zn-dependent oxidoreductase
MKAIVLDGYGRSDRLVLREVPDPPQPGPGEVRIRVRAAGVNPVDWKVRRGSLRFLMPARFPLVLGRDVAGEVEAIGPEVARLAVGDPVFGGCDATRHGGAYAELVLAREEALCAKPEALGWEEAAALPLAGLTALQALRDQGELVRGERVLVNGASGGVGHFAVQIAFAYGARVTGVASRGRLDFVRGLGAEQGIDYEEESFTARDEAWDLVFDVAGLEAFRDCEPVLSRDGGIFVSTRPDSGLVFWSLATTIGGAFDSKVRRARMIVTRFLTDDLATLAQLFAQGRLASELAEVVPLAAAGRAHDLGEAGHVRGKIVLRID